jgi:hypothetical protein
MSGQRLEWQARWFGLPLRACLDHAPNSPANIGKPIFWRTILPPTFYQRAGVESERDDQKIGVVTILWR